MSEADVILGSKDILKKKPLASLGESTHEATWKDCEEWLKARRTEGTQTCYFPIWAEVRDNLKSWGKTIWTATQFDMDRCYTKFANRPVDNEEGHPKNGQKRQWCSAVNTLIRAVGRDRELYVEPPKREDTPPRSWATIEESQKVLDQAKPDSMYYAISLVQMGTGRRPGDVRKMEFEHLDRDEGYYYFDKTKNKRNTNDKLTPMVLAAINWYIDNVRPTPKNPKDEKYIWISSERKWINRDFIGQMFGRLIYKAGIDQEKRNLTPMSFRHSFCTRGIQSGIRPEIIAGIVGNSAEMVDKVYNHELQEAKDRAIEKLAFFEPKTGPPSVILESKIESIAMDPTEQRRIAKEKVLSGEWDQETFKIVWANIPTPEQEARL